MNIVMKNSEVHARIPNPVKNLQLLEVWLKAVTKKIPCMISHMDSMQIKALPDERKRVNTRDVNNTESPPSIEKPPITAAITHVMSSISVGNAISPKCGSPPPGTVR
uniref:Uncharacterized protein n=1 Tax=Lotharella globosa TaxID=91324 RepID=A0A6V3J3T0_9EUKA|mmetsp:Transcript_36991/g.71359  ORF Transcript_36991/g.71359 Transcript_36991/m.71359 type:complete len:107 (+) Transcript_36991:1236-1556(+)